MKTTKRFIAGAVCPKCGEMDRLVMFREADKTFRECVACGFQEELLVTAVPQPLPTRIDAPPEESRDKPQAVRFIDPENT